MGIKYVFSSACVLALTGSLVAQTTPAGQPPRPPAAAPTVPSPYPTPLYRMPDVSKSLNLTPDQVTRLNALTDQVQARYRDNYAGLNSVAEAERAARARELNRQYAGDWNKAARDVFNDTQRARYQQLAYQYGGFDALYDPDVQARLALTPAQTKALADQVQWNNRQLQEVYRMGATDPTTGAKAYRDYWTQRQERFNTYLTPQQQKAWAELTGEAYTFQPAFPRR